MSLGSDENNSCGTIPTSLDNTRLEIETAYAENKEIASGFPNKFAPVERRYKTLLNERSSEEEDTNLEGLAATMKCLTKFENNLSSRYLSSLGPGSGYNHDHEYFALQSALVGCNVVSGLMDEIDKQYKAKTRRNPGMTVAGSDSGKTGDGSDSGKTVKGSEPDQAEHKPRSAEQSVNHSTWNALRCQSQTIISNNELYISECQKQFEATTNQANKNNYKMTARCLTACNADLNRLYPAEEPPDEDGSLQKFREKTAARSSKWIKIAGVLCPSVQDQHTTTSQERDACHSDFGV